MNGLTPEQALTQITMLVGWERPPRFVNSSLQYLNTPLSMPIEKRLAEKIIAIIEQVDDASGVWRTTGTLTDAERESIAPWDDGSYLCDCTTETCPALPCPTREGLTEAVERILADRGRGASA